MRHFPALGIEALEDRCVPSYSIIDLGTLPGYPNCVASGINEFSQVSATAQRPFGARAVLWNSGTLTEVGTLGGKDSFGHALNSTGQLVGSAATVAGTFHAFLWSEGVMIDLEPAGGGKVNSAATGINAFGQVVGERAPSDGKVPQHAFLYSKGTLTNLNDLVPPGSGWFAVRAAGINDAGQVVGLARDTAGFLSHGFLYSEGALTILDTLGGDLSEAFGLNAFGQVVGSAEIAGNASYHAVLWDSATPTDLGTLGGNFSAATAINSLGQVVGSADTATGDTHAFLFENGAMTDLNDLLPAGSGWVVTNARGINDVGQIVGEGEIEGQFHAFLMTPQRGGAPGSGPSSSGLDPAAVQALLWENSVRSRDRR